MSGLEVHVRRKAYGKVTALENVRFSLPAGQLAALVGPSGCGKSTLTNIIAGLDGTADAEVTVAGRPPAEAATPGVVFQTARLMPWLTVLENLQLVAHGSNRGGGRAAELLALVGLAGYRHQWPDRLSGGMQRRVAFARALVNAPSLLLLDEPFQSLDTLSAARMRDALIGFWRDRGATVLMVTHDLGEAVALADRVLVMSPGPGTVVDDIPLDLPRPREAALIERMRRRIEAGFRERPATLRDRGAA